MDILLSVLGGILILFGVVGCFLPILPGPPLSYIGVLFLHFTSQVQFSATFLIVSGVIVLIVSLLDYLVPVLGAKKFGGSSSGIVGCIVGLVLGIFLFPPVGIIIGPFLGAVLGELVNGDDLRKAVKSGLGSFLGYIFGTGVKLAVSIVMGYFFVDGLLQ
jgi:uncharacterized protein YqgC (DUF456 family)